jgi:excisionase family DNA binding protein
VGECRVTAPNIESPYLTVEETAAYLRVSVRTLETFRQEKSGPAYHKHGGKVVYRKDDLDAWSRQVRFDFSGAPPQAAPS